MRLDFPLKPFHFQDVLWELSQFGLSCPVNDVNSEGGSQSQLFSKWFVNQRLKEDIHYQISAKQKKKEKTNLLSTCCIPSDYENNSSKKTKILGSGEQKNKRSMDLQSWGFFLNGILCSIMNTCRCISIEDRKGEKTEGGGNEVLKVCLKNIRIKWKNFSH